MTDSIWDEDWDVFWVLVRAIAFLFRLLRLVVQEDAFALLTLYCMLVKEDDTHRNVLVDVLLGVHFMTMVALHSVLGWILSVAWLWKVYSRVEGVLMWESKRDDTILGIRSLLMNAHKDCPRALFSEGRRLNYRASTKW
jgi:hypothetical protein